MRDSCKLQMRKGNQVNFWKDTWLTGFCLADSYPALFNSALFLNWIRPLRARENLNLHGLMFDLNLVGIHRTNKDKLIWEQGKEGEYIVNSYLLVLDRKRFAGTKPYATDTWKSICPPKT